MSDGADRSVTSRTAMQLAAATEATATSNSAESKPQRQCLRKIEWKNQQCSCHRNQACGKTAALLRDRSAEPRYGSEASRLAKTGTRENSATRVESSMDPLATAINSAGTTKRPIPTRIDSTERSASRPAYFAGHGRGAAATSEYRQRIASARERGRIRGRGRAGQQIGSQGSGSP